MVGRCHLDSSIVLCSNEIVECRFCSHKERGLCCKNVFLDEDVWLFAAFSCSVYAHLLFILNRSFSLNSSFQCLLTSNIYLRESKKYFNYRFQIVEIVFTDFHSNKNSILCKKTQYICKLHWRWISITARIICNSFPRISAPIYSTVDNLIGF